ncbi:M24 family metallopeptidase [Paenibacillus thermotolerans]|uniref:M24 family metallopeptidase n=1 Tax=Paenibacillus thermotolerans TaxID=3027807 RepID=UPI0023674B4E|nr:MULTISPECIES: Xaa-Pro peptidase family protein [unclassified Paenibacillus]
MSASVNRVTKLRESLNELQIDALLITNPVNRKYLTGFTGTAGNVLITESRAVLFTDFRYVTQASEQAAGFETIEHDSANPLAAVREAMRSAGLSKLGFEQENVSYGAYGRYAAELGGDITLVPTAGTVERLRRIKDAGEIQLIREAVAVSDAAFTHILPFLKPGVKETDVSLELETFMRRQGASATSFATIVASGERSALPHGVASGRVLGTNEFVKMDYGALYKGYCSDMTRTVFIGQPTAKHREIWDIVLEAQLACLAGLKPGMTGKEGDALARDVIAKYGYGDNFGHGTGHSVGMEIHESPNLNKRESSVLEPGMVVTVEPGIYLPGFGGVRIEDMVVITETGCDILTKSSKEFITL